MKAIVRTQYGSPDVLCLEEVEKPVPENNEILIKIYATSLNAGDWHLLRGDPLIMRLATGIFSPKNKILGGDVSGCVEMIGNDVKEFKVGDEVFGISPLLSNPERSGTFAEYVCVPENLLVHKPKNISFEEAAVLPTAAMTALQGLGKITPEQKVLINGASGGVGTFAVQIAKSFGAEVTAVCSTRNLEMAKSIGADHVIDYTQEDFTKNGKLYDLIFAANGYHWIFDYRQSLNNNGVYVMTGGSNSQMFEAMFMGSLISIFGNKKMYNLLMNPNKNDLLFIKELVETKKIVPVIDKCYTLNEIPEAIKYIEEGHAKGKVSIKNALLCSEASRLI
jgi:NADPH:quinone reductase-like Zn-dependent oxidoreductase